MLTRDEISGLTSGLLVSHDPPLGKLAFSAWLDQHADEIGRRYANELERHSRPPEPLEEWVVTKHTYRCCDLPVLRTGRLT